MIPTALLARASRETAIAIYLRSLGWVDISISIFGRYLGSAEILISISCQIFQKQADLAPRYGRLKTSPTHSRESRYVNAVICIEKKISASLNIYTLPFSVTMHQIPFFSFIFYICSFRTKIKRDY